MSTAEAAVAARVVTMEYLRERYPNCSNLEVPGEALDSWTEKELDLFFASMGLIRPRTVEEVALADAHWREKLATDKEERSWRSAEAEGVAIVVRKVDAEAAKRKGAALARARGRRSSWPRGRGGGGGAGCGAGAGRRTPRSA